MIIIIIGLLFLVSNPVHAAVYKCTKDGRTAYQEQPCEQSGVEMKKFAKTGSSMAGCYMAPSYGGKEQKLEIESIGNGKFLLNFLLPESNKRDQPEPGFSGFPMKQASELELRQLEAGNRTDENNQVIEGISLIDWGRNPPLGIFKARVDGRESYLTVWPYMGGESKKISCR